MEDVFVPIWVVLKDGEVRDGWIRQDLVQKAEFALHNGDGDMSIILEKKWGMPTKEPLRIKDILLRIL